MVDKNKKRIVILDSHAIIHRAYHALPNFSTASGEPTGGLYGLSAMLIKIISDLKPDYVVACYDLPEPTFRHESYKEYKKGRAKTDDELISQIIRSRDIFEAFNIPFYEKSGFEADDLIGTITEKLKDKKDLEIIIASGDMDTFQLIKGDKVRVYTLKKGINDTIIYNEKRVVERFGFKPELLVDFKGLRGDPSDNIIGIAGIGEKTATILIQNFGTIENIYKKLKKDKKILEKAKIKERMIRLLEEGEEEALFSKTLATIKRDVEMDFNIPDKTWKDGLEIEKMDKLFGELEFRTLRNRARELFGGGEKEKVISEKIDEIDEEKTALALWLVDSNITNPDLDDILQFGRTDSYKEAKEKIFKELKNRKLEKLYNEVELPIMEIIKEAEDRGILIDKNYLQKLSKDYHKKLSGFEKAIWKFSGREFNINSPKQLSEILFDDLKLSPKGIKKTSSGARSTKESELLKLKDQHEIIKEILSYRELQKLLSTYIDNIPAMVGEDGRLHTRLNQTGTSTGRFSSNKPNLQNIPTRSDAGHAVRGAFVAPKEQKLVSFDYSQIEMRILAVLAKDEKLINVFKKGEDVHTAVAKKVFGIKKGDEPTKEMRRRAKIINFGIAYGMGINALKDAMGSDRKEAQEFYDNYFASFPKIEEYFINVKKEALERGYTTTIMGRRRYLENLKSKIPFIRAMAERMAMNAPIQGTAADVVKLALGKVAESIKEAGMEKEIHFLLQVHDELIFEIKKDVLDKAKKIIQEAMESALDLGVPLVVNIKEGNKWNDLA